MKLVYLISMMLFGGVAIDSNPVEEVMACDPGTRALECVPQLTYGFNFLKTYKVDGNEGAKDKVEYSYVFTKGTQYMLNICTENGTPDGVTVSLYDSKRNMVGSSMHKGENLSAFVYPCKVTGIYYIRYTFNDSESYCAGSALGFKK